MHTKSFHRFKNRKEAGRELAKCLNKFAKSPDTIVLALPNGGVPVGAEVASRLHKPFDVLLLEKLTTPGCGDMPLGAVTAGGVRMLNCALIDRLHLSPAEINTAVLRGCQKLARREKICRGHPATLEIADQTVILVDDGATPCATIRDAIRLLRRQHADRVVVALPAACRHHACDLRLEADEVVTLAEPATPRTAGKYYHQHHRTTDAEVRRLLAETCPAN